jgi:hypothetical protein
MDTKSTLFGVDMEFPEQNNIIRLRQKISKSPIFQSIIFKIFTSMKRYYNMKTHCSYFDIQDFFVKKINQTLMYPR